MSEFEQISPVSNVARVRVVENDGRRLYLEFPNGVVTTVTNKEPFEFCAGSIVLVRMNDQYIEVAPDDLWPEESWVGVVRLIKGDITVVGTNVRWIKVPTSSTECQVGNTVEVLNSRGVIRVLSKDPIKTIDLSAIDDTVIESFKLIGTGSEKFSDFGGLQDIVDRARELIEVSLKNREALTAIGVRPIKGVLFTGLPGTGKTMLARIIANTAEATFYRISGPEIFSKWYGESEKVLRKLFKDAAKNAPAIIFFDEIDSVAGHRDADSHEASRRVVAQLLTLMDGFRPEENVVVIAATNRPQDIDAALRRPGRFDWEIHFPLPKQPDRELILKKSAQSLAVSDDLPHSWIAKKTEGWSGADLTAIWSEAALIAVNDGREKIITEDYIGGFERVLASKASTKGNST